MKIKHIIPVISLAAVIGITGCSDKDDHTSTGSSDARSMQTEPTLKEQAKRAAEEVDATLDHATAKASTAVDDAGITASIKSKLITEDSLSALDIHVDTDAGVVLLSGTVPSEAAKTLAGNIASRIDGVASVDNRLIVTTHE